LTDDDVISGWTEGDCGAKTRTSARPQFRGIGNTEKTGTPVAQAGIDAAARADRDKATSLFPPPSPSAANR